MSARKFTVRASVGPVRNRAHSCEVWLQRAQDYSDAGRAGLARLAREEAQRHSESAFLRASLAFPSISSPGRAYPSRPGHSPTAQAVGVFYSAGPA